MREALFAWISRFQADQAQRKRQTIRLDHCSSSIQNPCMKVMIQLDTPQRKRTSRYLSERDRWEIIRRISDGEQQAALAKEFDVSRAAICNLYKNRSRVLSRGVSDMEATHPKKPRSRKTSDAQANEKLANDSQSSVIASTSISPDIRLPSNEAVKGREDVSMDSPYSYSPMRSEDVSSGDEWTEIQTSRAVTEDQLQHQDHVQQQELNQRPSDQRGPSQRRTNILAGSRPFLVHEASVHSYSWRNLVAALRGENTSTILFQQRVTRLARLLIEEVLTCLPHNNEDVTNQYGDICRVAKIMEERDVWGISMEGRGSVLVRAFSDISPVSPAGIVSISSEKIGDNKAVQLVKSHLPTLRQGQVVLLLDIQCATGNEACAVLHHLVHDKQIASDKIYYVTILSSFEGLQKVSKTFPGVTLVTAQMDTVLDQHQRIRPGIGDFMQRLWEFKASPFV